MDDQRSSLLSFNGMKQLLGTATATTVRFPLVLLVCFACAGHFINTFHSSAKLEDLFNDFGSLLLISIPASLSLSLIWERKHSSAVTKVYLSLGIMGALVFFYMNHGMYKDQNSALHFLQYHIAALLSVSLLAPTSDKENSFWASNQQIFSRYLLAILFSAVLFLGLFVCVHTVFRLFELRINNELHKYILQDLWVVCALLFQPWFFLAGIPRAGEEKDTLPVALRVLIQYIVIPLTYCYLAILLSYTLMIIVRAKVPDGIIGNLVSGICLVGLISFLVIEPSTKNSEQRWLKLFSRALFYALIPLCGLVIYAASIRINEYGLTEQRYMLIVLGAWMLAVSIYFAFFKNRNLRVIPASLMAILLLSSFGRWGAFQTAIASQTKRFEKYLQDAGALNGNTLGPASKAISVQNSYAIKDILSYFEKSYRDPMLVQYFPPTEITVYQRLNYLSLIVDKNLDTKQQVLSHHLDANENAIEVAGFKYAAPITLRESESDIYAGSQHYTVRLDSNKPIIVLKANGRDITFDVSTKLKELTDVKNTKTIIYLRSGIYTIAITNMSAQTFRDSEEAPFKVSYLSGYLLIK